MALDEVRGVNIADLKPADSEFQLVTLKAKDVEPEVNILFKKKKADVDRIKKCFPKFRSGRQIGSYAFDYFMKKECR